MSDVKITYQKMFALAQAYNACAEYYEEPIFQAFLANLINSKPKELDTTSILTDTYNFFQRWQKCWGDIQWATCLDEAKVLEKKHNQDMCNDMLVQLIDIIEKQFKGVK